MLWIFAILGLVSLMSALYGLSTTWSLGGRVSKMHFLALVLLAVAWTAEHTTVIGWVALGAGAAVELVDRWLWLFSRRVRGGAMAPVLVRTAVASAETSRVRSAEPRAGDVEAPAALSVRETVAPIAPDLEAEESDAESAGAEEDDPAVQEPAPEGPTIAQLSGADEGPAESREETELLEPTAGVSNASQAAEETALGENHAPAEPTATAPCDAPADTPPPPPSLSTIVLLRTRYDVAPTIFFASLRRSGQRDALLVEAPDAVGETWVQVGRVVLRLRAEAGPCDPQVLEEWLAATTDWPEAASITADHEAHLVLMSEYAEETPRDEVIRLLHRAHAALAEFAPVVAVAWAEAGRLVRADDLASLLVRAADMESRMAETCVQVRTFALSEPNDGLFLSDCVGLCALGLPDVQFITVGEPGERVLERLHGLAERFLTTGCDLADGSDFDMGDGEAWRVTHARGAFPPDREVIQITVKR